MIILTILTIVLIITILSVIANIIIKESNLAPEKKIIPRIISLIIVISSVSFFVYSYNLLSKAQLRGVDKPQYLTIEQLKIGNENIPIQSDIKKINMKETNLIVFYKFGCKDCIEHLPKIRQMLKGEPNVYYLNRNNKDVKKFMKENFISITNVPTGLLSKHDGSRPIYTKYVLYSETIHESHFEPDRLNRLLELKHR